MTIGQYLENKLGEAEFKALLEAMRARTRKEPRVRR